MSKRWTPPRAYSSQELESVRRHKGHGNTREWLEKLGVPWPPPKGWRKAILATEALADVRQDRDGRFRWVVLGASDGKVVMTSTASYATHAEARCALASRMRGRHPSESREIGRHARASNKGPKIHMGGCEEHDLVCFLNGAPSHWRTSTDWSEVTCGNCLKWLGSPRCHLCVS